MNTETWPIKNCEKNIRPCTNCKEGKHMRPDRRWKFFKCKRCGKCCAEIGLPYDPESIFSIANHLGLTIDQVIAKFYGRIVDGGHAWESEDCKRKPCPFLRTDGDMKSCEIYLIRPAGCKKYPFDTDFGRAGVDCTAAETVYAKLRKEEHD
jgi:Fe-S-cluster containining protein